MSVPGSVVRRTVRKDHLSIRDLRLRRTFQIHSDSPKDTANELSKRILSTRLSEQKLFADNRQHEPAENNLKILIRTPQTARITPQKRLSWFRDLVKRCDVEGYGSLLKTGIRRALDDGPSPLRPSDLLRYGERLLQTQLAYSKGTAPTTSSTIGLEDADSTILRLLSVNHVSLKERRRVLRIFNAFVSRLELQGHPISAAIAIEGQYLAANARSVGALVRYAQMAASQSESSSTPHPDLVATMSSIRQWLLADESGGCSQRAALSALFAKEHSNSTEALYRNFRSQFTSLDAGWRWDYLDILRRLHGAQEVLAAWTEFQRTQRWERLAKKLEKDSLVELASTLHDVVEQLIMANEPRLAWVVVHSLDWEPRSVLSKTWALLLDFPEYLTQTKDGMQEVLLQVYEEQVKRIEESLGIRWTGGEEGSHVFMDDGEDSQALVGEEDVSEEAQKG